MIPLARALALLVFGVVLAGEHAMAADDYSQRLDALWSFDDPVASEQRFRAEMARHAPGSREALEAATQVARAEGLQRKFAATDSTLDGVARVLDRAPARVGVRYLLERGRRQNSSGRPRDAMPLFAQALATSERDMLPDAAFYRVDALHMLGIAAEPAERLDWDLKALAAADAASEARARGWRGSLLHNIGWAYHERGDYQRALEAWQKALAAREAAGDVARTPLARWTIARGLRSLGRLDEAEAIQRALAADHAAANTEDGYVYEELAEIALARGDAAAAKPWAAKAYALLKDDAFLAADEPARLARLARIGDADTAAAR
jgi:tetratricopeptide (TPR) repeat protein